MGFIEYSDGRGNVIGFLGDYHQWNKACNQKDPEENLPKTVETYPSRERCYDEPIEQ